MEPGQAGGQHGNQRHGGFPALAPSRYATCEGTRGSPWSSQMSIEESIQNLKAYAENFVDGVKKKREFWLRSG
jgi:hypothetical protein